MLVYAAGLSTGASSKVGGGPINVQCNRVTSWSQIETA